MGNITEYAGKQFVSANSQDLQLGKLAGEEEKKWYKKRLDGTHLVFSFIRIFFINMVSKDNSI